MCLSVCLTGAAHCPLFQCLCSTGAAHCPCISLSVSHGCRLLSVCLSVCVPQVLPISYVSQCLLVSHRCCPLPTCLSVCLCPTVSAYCPCVSVSVCVPQVMPIVHVSQCLCPTVAAHCPCVSVSVCVQQVLPIAHVSGGAKNRVNLVNPNAVNLKEYEEKLEKALARYRQ